MGPPAEVSAGSNSGVLTKAARVVLGSLAGFYYFVLPWYMWLKNLIFPKSWAI